MAHPVWHPDVHQVKLRTNLYYIFLASYGDFREFSKDVLAHFNAKYPEAFSFYYVYGNFDIVVRIWLSHNESQSLQRALKEMLRPYAGTVDVFSADVVHYLWAKDCPDRLDEGLLLDSRVQTRHIKAIQESDNQIDNFYWDNRLVLETLEQRQNGQNEKIKSFILFDFGSASANVFSILQEELIVKLSDHFAGDHVSVYFGHGAGSMLVKQVAGSIGRLSAIGEFVRRELSLLRARSSTYVVGRVVCESDNAVIDGDESAVELHLPEQVQTFVARYPEARKLPPEALFVAFSINAHMEESVARLPRLKRPYSLLVKSMVVSDRSTLINSIIGVGELLQNEFHRLIPLIATKAFGEDWEERVNVELVRDQMEKSKPWNKLSLGELLQLTRVLNEHAIRDPLISEKAWEDSVSSFISWRNKAAHDAGYIDFPRIYEISTAYQRLAGGLQKLNNIAEDYVAS